ncbi:MAG: hypothetical protein KGI14_04695 [Acidobacteriota bacterium]|nr:hypothetical protein [Acidobacteriota bacterium]
MRRPPRHLRTLSAIASVSVLALALPVTNALSATPRVVVASATTLTHGETVASPGGSTNFDVVLRQPHQRELTAFLSSLYNPRSPNFRHFVTPSTFARRFGASKASVRAVRAYFASYGVRVTGVNKARTLVSLRGHDADVARAFATSVENIRTPGGVVVAQFARAASVPSSLAPDVAAVVGLSTPGIASPHLSRTLTSSAPHGPTTCPSAGDATTNGPNQLYGYTAQQQAKLYGFDQAWAAGNTGVGQTIAVYELGLFSQSDVNTYFSCYGVSPNVTVTNVDGGPGSGFSDEATLDTEEVGVLAPGAKIEIYQGPNNNSGPLDVYARVADDNTANVLSVSWGTCETDPNGDTTGEQAIFEQMAAQGQSVLASAGDSGSSDCTGGSTSSTALAVDDPASQPFVTGVGGLTVTSISPLNETVWSQSSAGSACGGAGGGGGGASVIWSRPSWQVTTGPTASVTTRMVPDLSVMGDPSTGFIQYFPNSGGCATPAWFTIGGTSIGSPLVSALVAVATQACNVGRLGFLNPQLYQMPSSDFVDVTTGSNDVYGLGNYSAGPGYDMASGLGSPNGAAFISGLCPDNNVDPSKSSFTKSTGTPVAPSGTATVSATLHNANGAALANQIVNVEATSSSGELTIDADATSRQGPGHASYPVTTDANGSVSSSISSTAGGPVHVTLTYHGAVIYETTFDFVAGSTSPKTPRVVAITATSGGFVLRVQSPTTNESGVTRFQYSLNGGASWVTFTSTTVNVRNLLKHHVYLVRVRALNAAGVSPASPTRRVVTKS